MTKTDRRNGVSEILIPHEKVKAQRIKKDRLISKKQQEINDLKDKLTTANKRIEVLEEALRIYFGMLEGASLLGRKEELLDILNGTKQLDEDIL